MSRSQLKVLMFHPYVPREVEDEVIDTLRSRWIGQGPKVELFEELFEKQFGLGRHRCVSLNSGTSALETAYDLIGIKPGDEVITTPLTCTATNLPLLARGAKLIWADIDPATLCIDPVDIKRKITDRTKAIVQVHLGGIRSLATDFDLCDRHIPIVSDACQALGIFDGDYTCNSFQSIKHITTADGGMIHVTTAEDYRKAKLMRWFGIDRDKKIKNNWQCYKKRQMTFDIQMMGYKRQMTDVQASMGIVGLNKYDFVIEHRGKVFDVYRQRLRKIPGLKLIDGFINTYWLATVLVEDRDKFSKLLFRHGIDNNMVQLRNDIYDIFGGKRQDLPNMNDIENKYISIPIGNHVSVKDANYICKVIQKGW